MFVAEVVFFQDKGGPELKKAVDGGGQLFFGLQMGKDEVAAAGLDGFDDDGVADFLGVFFGLVKAAAEVELGNGQAGGL